MGHAQYIDLNGYTDITISLRKKCPYSEFFWPVLSHIRTEYGEMFCISPYSVRPNGGKYGSKKLRIRTLSTQYFTF